MPGCKAKGHDAEAVGHPCATTGMDLPAAPECDRGGDDHENSAERIHRLPRIRANLILARRNPDCMLLNEIAATSEGARQSLDVMYPLGEKDGEREALQLGVDADDECDVQEP